MNDTDMAGPLIFWDLPLAHPPLSSLFASFSNHSLFLLLISVSVGCVVSVLGYCLLPMVFLSCFSLIVSLQ